MPATNSKGIQALAADTARHIQSAYEAPSILQIVQALVSDNGCGIEQNSLKLLAQHGCTSKATSVGCGNALAAVLSVSAQLKICTRTVDEDAATMLILDSNRQVVDRSFIAGNLGTTVTVLQPLSKLPVRYEIAKSQGARNKKDVRHWLTLYYLANYHIATTLVFVGANQGPQIRSTGLSHLSSLSLNNVVMSVCGASCGASIVEVKFPNALQPSNTPRTIKHKQLDGVSFEGVFCKPGCEITNESRLPKFGISINGAVCKADVLPGFLERLLVAYPTTVRGKAIQHFVGILNLVVSPTKLDISLREPSIQRQFEVECIEAAIAEEVISVLQRHSNPTEMSIVRAPVAHKYNPSALPTQSLAQWPVNRREVGQPNGSTQPSRKRKAKQQQNTNRPCSDQRSKMPWSQSQLQLQLQLLPNNIIAPESIAKSVPNCAPCSDTMDIPRASWTSHSPELDSILSSGQTGRVLCIVLTNGTVCSVSTYKSLPAGHGDEVSVYLIWTADILLAMDAYCLPPLLDLTDSSIIRLKPEFKSRVCMALINNH
ncbi:ATP-binding mismatch repair protein [Coemansia aciculifera]|nr:ATP-binding mismatch repair protein [Coemansia aciculifera]